MWLAIESRPNVQNCEIKLTTLCISYVCYSNVPNFISDSFCNG